MAWDVLILIPAAGAGRRMRGRDKLLERIDGRPLLARQAARARATGCAVLVTLPQADEDSARARGAALQGLDVALLSLPDAAEGMAASLRAGARAAQAAGVAGMMVLPADMPDLDTADLGALCAVFSAAEPGTIVQGATATGEGGHPVILPAALLDKVALLRGDVGARALLQDRRTRICRHFLPGMRARTDLDTPEAWVAWRAARDLG